MLGVIVGLITTVGLLTFLNRDPVAVQRHRREQKQIKEKQQKELQKFKQEQQKRLKDPLLKQRREQKQKQFKQKLLKNLNEEERKLIEDYMNQQKNAGKSERDIIKDAGLKAMLFFLFIVIVLIALAVAAVLLAGGDLTKMQELFEKAAQLVRNFLEWNFPKLANNEL